ncbi:MAG: hypothetical protein PHS14_03485 [Elusimicrobia bacterium]|nr:hypothetical protein [Elusimicrobiota bacterium]
MKFISRIAASSGLITSMAVFCHAAQLDPAATNIAPSVVVSVALSTDSTFEYSYEIISGSASAQDIGDFSLKVGTIAIIPNIKSPPGWISVSNTFGTRGLLAWGAVAASRIKPKTSTSGFVIFSQNPPDIRDSLIRGFVPVPVVNFVDENTPAARDIEEDSVHIPTIGPGAFAFTDTASSIDRLISLKHQVASRGWLGNAKFVLKLDKRLDQAKAALAQNKKTLARTRLTQFIHDLTAAHKDSEHEHGDKDKDDRRREKFVNDEAFQLLKINADFIIAKLPAKAKDKDEEDECRRAEGEKGDDPDDGGKKDKGRDGGKEHDR